MGTLDYVLIALIAAAFVAAVVYAWKHRDACIGCPDRDHCPSRSENCGKKPRR